MSEAPAVVVVGSLHFDVMVQSPYLPRMGETLMGDAWWWKPGGKGGNQAMAAARHGAATEMIGTLGDDLFGMRLRDRLRSAGVGLGHVATVVQGSGMSVAIQEQDGDYAAIVVSGANRELAAAHAQAGSAVISAANVLLLQNEIAESANVAAAQVARTAGTTVVLNAAPARPMGAMADLVDVLVINAVEAEQLGSGAVEDQSSAERAAATLQDLAPVVVVTAGASGIAVTSEAGALSLTAYQVEQPSAHGAGDTFTGALAARLAAGDQLEPAVRYANAAAALHVGSSEEQRDGIGPADVQALLSGAAGG